VKIPNLNINIQQLEDSTCG